MRWHIYKTGSRLCVRFNSSRLSMKTRLVPSVDKQKLAHTVLPHVVHIFASEPLEHPGGTEEATQGIRRRGIATDLCRVCHGWTIGVCGCALTERRKKIHAQMELEGWGVGGCKTYPSAMLVGSRIRGCVHAMAASVTCHSGDTGWHLKPQIIFI